MKEKKKAYIEKDFDKKSCSTDKEVFLCSFCNLQTDETCIEKKINKIYWPNRKDAIKPLLAILDLINPPQDWNEKISLNQEFANKSKREKTKLLNKIRATKPENIENVWLWIRRFKIDNLIYVIQDDILKCVKPVQK